MPQRRWGWAWAALAACALGLAPTPVWAADAASPERPDLASATAGRLAALALGCVHREYPNKIAHVLQEDADARAPRELTPSFYGCYDWHSAVHGHWLLARLARLYPDAPWAEDARAALDRNLTPERIAGEVAYLRGPGRETFERPYGLAWLLQLDAELAADAPRRATEPLARDAAERFRTWLPKLSHPIRTGEHSQTAFAFGLVLDWARALGDVSLARLVEERTRALYLDDRDCPLAYEPSGQDFLSPCLAEADLVRRILPPPVYAAWLGRFLPQIPIAEAAPDAPGASWLEPAVVTDPTDGKLAHLDGLNLSRAWMLEGIASGLPGDDPRRAALLEAAREHRDSGVASVTGEHYEGGHWLGSFAAYLLTRRGLPNGGAP